MKHKFMFLCFCLKIYIIFLTWMFPANNCFVIYFFCKLHSKFPIYKQTWYLSQFSFSKEYVLCSKYWYFMGSSFLYECHWVCIVSSFKYILFLYYIKELNHHFHSSPVEQRQWRNWSFGGNWVLEEIVKPYITNRG